jgi:hypothetical protein
MRYRLSQLGRRPRWDMQTVRDGDTAGFILCHTVLQYSPPLDVSCIHMWVYLEPHTATASVRWTICVLNCSLPAAGNAPSSSSVLSDSSFVVPLYARSLWQWGQCRRTRVRSIFGFIPPRLEFFSVILGSLVLYFSFHAKAVCTYTCIENCALQGCHAARSNSTIYKGPSNALVCIKTLIQMSHTKTLKITPTCFDHLIETCCSDFKCFSVWHLNCTSALVGPLYIVN